MERFSGDAAVGAQMALADGERYVCTSAPPRTAAAAAKERGAEEGEGERWVVVVVVYLFFLFL